MMLTVSSIGMICRKRSIVGAALVAMGAVSLLSCAQTAQRPQPQPLINTGKPAIHAVMSDEMRQAMARLNQVSNVDMRAELYSGDVVAPHMDRVAAIATDLANAAEKLPALVDRLDMPSAHRQVFVKLAEKLRADALQLHDDAFRQDIQAARAAMDRVETTCNSCHALFRERPLPSKKAT